MEEALFGRGVTQGKQKNDVVFCAAEIPAKGSTHQPIDSLFTAPKKTRLIATSDMKSV